MSGKVELCRRRLSQMAHVPNHRWRTAGEAIGEKCAKAPDGRNFARQRVT
jgi:hypothetical protein